VHARGNDERRLSEQSLVQARIGNARNAHVGARHPPAQRLAGRVVGVVLGAVARQQQDIRVEPEAKLLQCLRYDAQHAFEAGVVTLEVEAKAVSHPIRDEAAAVVIPAADGRGDYRLAVAESEAAQVFACLLLRRRLEHEGRIRDDGDRLLVQGARASRAKRSRTETVVSAAQARRAAARLSGWRSGPAPIESPAMRELKSFRRAMRAAQYGILIRLSSSWNRPPPAMSTRSAADAARRSERRATASVRNHLGNAGQVCEHCRQADDREVDARIVSAQTPGERAEACAIANVVVRSAAQQKYPRTRSAAWSQTPVSRLKAKC
jgi:hypothetical protein